MRQVMRPIGIVLVAILSGCTTTVNPDYCDEATPCADPATPYCDIAGNFGNTHECTTTPDPDYDAAIADAAFDGGLPDAARIAAYEVAYGNVFTFVIADLVVNDWLIVINTGDLPLDMETIEVLSVSDDHPTANIRVEANPHTATITPGSAGGHLSTGYEDPVINSGLVTEPRVNFGSGAFSVLRMWLDPVGAPGGMYDVRTDVTMAINGVEKELSILIHVDATEFHTATGFVRQ